MKISPRFSARRIAQGGATFAAFGALSLAAAMPAAADTTYGWGYATATGGQAEAATDVTQSGSASGTTGGVVQMDDCFSLDAETTATVGAGGVTATTVINSASIKLTQECFDGLPEEEAPRPDEGDEGNEGDNESPAPTETPAEGDEGNEGDNESPVPTEEPVEGGEGNGETQSPEPTTDPTAETASDEATEVVTLDETNSTTVSATGDLVADIEVTGASVTTTQSWDGVVDHSVNPGSSTGGAVVFGDHYAESFEEDGVTWNDGITDIWVTFSVQQEEGVADVSYYLGTTAAAVATVADGGNGGGDDDGGDDGDDQNPPTRDEEPEDEKPAPQSVEPLPQTGSPVLGLIGAGAAIAVGGGAAAYLARRKKTTATAEENGEG